jgi:protocatechuate 3,4-dioxygenase beta subunit
MISTKLKVLAVLLLAMAGALAAGAGVVGRRETTPPPNSGPAGSAQPPRKGSQSAAAEKAGQQRPASARPRAEHPVVVSGRVLGPDGKPVAGARLYWLRVKGEPRSEEDIEFLQRGTSDAQGRFRLELPPSDVRPGFNPPLVAAADGYGVDGAELPRGGGPAELTLRLVKDQPIRGRIINTEGRPVAGARVAVDGLFASAEERLDDFLTAWKREWRLAWQRTSKHLFLPHGRVLSAATDKDGRFRISGAGAERVATLRVKGPGIAQAELYVLTRPGFDPGPYNRAVLEGIPPELRIPGQPPLLYGPTLDYVAKATRIIEGTVREAGSGKPVAGVGIFAGAGYTNFVRAVSDRQGRYQLVGLPKMKSYLLNTYTGENSSWLPQGARVQDTEGMQPLHVDFELTKGVVLTGRLIDRSTGKGVRGGIRFVPLPDNKYFGRKGHDSYRYNRLMTGTDTEGRFRLSVIPGSGVLLAQVFGLDEKHIGGVPVKPYKRATLGPADRKRVSLTSDNTFTAAGNALEFLDSENACKVLDLAPDAGTITCDLFLDRGQTLTVQIQDSAGKPLPGALVSGMTASGPTTFPLREASCTVYALDPEKPRQLVFFHPGRKLAGQLTVRGDEKESPAVGLLPTGAVTGRVLDADGQLVAGAEIDLSLPGETAQELYRQLNQRREAVRTDRDGGFRLEGLVPGLKFGLSIRQGRTFLVGEPRIGLKEVGAGKTLDLGDIRTRPLPR